MIRSTLRDVKFALRRLRRTPAFAGVAILTLALGIGATTAVFSVVNGVLLRPLPFEEPEQLVGVWHSAPGWGVSRWMPQSPATYFTYREESRVFEDIGVWKIFQVTVTGLDQPERVTALLVTDGTLPILRVTPILGRTFTAEDDLPDAAPTVMLSHGYWRLRFGGDGDVIGRTLTIDGRQYEIIGVTPPGFDLFQIDPAVFLPYRFDRSQAAVFGDLSYPAVARLRPGVTIEGANADVARMIPLALEKFPGGIGPSDIESVQLGPDVHPLIVDAVGNVGTTLWIILGTVGIVLLIACANVANLFLVRAEGRRQEVAIRTAVGADRGRIAKHFFVESVTLAGLGGVVGLGLAWFGIDAFVAMGSQQLPRTSEIAIEPTVLLFTTAVTVVSGLFFGMFPVFRYSDRNLGTSLKEGGRSSGAGPKRQLVRHALVVSQMALALVLIAGSGLMIRSFQAMRRVSPGFERPDEVLTLNITPTRAEAEHPDATAATHEQILRRIQAIPGVTAAAFTSSITTDGRGSNQGIHVEEFPIGEDQAAPLRRFKWISPGYFETMGNPVLAGRTFSWADVHAKARVVVVTENFARLYWTDPGEALGKRIREGREQPWREIIGVVGNVHDDGANQAATATVYWPPVVEDFWGLDIFARRLMVYAIRSPRAGGVGLLDEVRQAVLSVHPTLPLANVQNLEDIYDRSMARTSFTMVMLAIAAAVALLIGAAGIYAVISYVVSQRTREIGVRIALGARQLDVTRMVLKHGLFLTGIGVVVGLTAAVGLTHLMSALLFGVEPVDPLTYGVVSIGLAAIALLASYLPSRRAARVDPVEALRIE
ncbi:MAG: ABC transporter permease [Gemmatimonadota bacterium]|nr:MAG: ABC transporter permease [Gemmatimonadota bacterium]